MDDDKFDKLKNEIMDLDLMLASIITDSAPYQSMSAYKNVRLILRKTMHRHGISLPDMKKKR
jgi:hypothetical protein